MHHRARHGRHKYPGIGDRRCDPTTDGRPCRLVGPGSGLRFGRGSPSLGPRRPDGDTRRSARCGHDSRSAGHGRTAERHRLRRTGGWSWNRCPVRGSGIRGRPTDIPTIRRDPPHRAAFGPPPRIGAVCPPSTDRSRPGGSRAHDRPSGNPIRRGRHPGIRRRPTGSRLGCCCIHRDRPTGKSFDQCGTQCGWRRDSSRRSFRRGIRPRPIGGSSRPALGSLRRPCGSPTRFRFRGRRGHRTDLRNLHDRHGTGDGPVDPAAAHHRRRGERRCVLRPAGRPCFGRPYVGRHRGRSSAGRRGRRRFGDRRVSRYLSDRRGDRRCDSPDRRRTASHPNGSPVHRGRRARHRNDEARPIRIGAPVRRPNDRTRRYHYDARRHARPGPRGFGPGSGPVRRHDGSNPSRCRPCPGRRRGDPTSHVRRRAGRRDHACHLNLDGPRAPNHDHCLADGYRRSHPRYS